MKQKSTPPTPTPNAQGTTWKKGTKTVRAWRPKLDIFYEMLSSVKIGKLDTGNLNNGVTKECLK